MTSPHAIKKSELKRAAELAKSENVVVEIEREGMKWRLMPNIPDIHRPQEPAKGKGLVF